MVAKAALPVPGPASKLDGKSLSHEIRSVLVARLAKWSREGRDLERLTYGRLQAHTQISNGVNRLGTTRLTRDDITGIHGVLVFDEAKAVHQLYLGDFSSAMSRKVGLNIGLGSCRQRVSWIARSDRVTSLWTIAREVPQVQPGGRYLRHVAVGSVESNGGIPESQDGKGWKTRVLVGSPGQSHDGTGSGVGAGLYVGDGIR